MLTAQDDLDSLAEHGRPNDAAAANQLTLPGVRLGGRPPNAPELLQYVRKALRLSQADMAQQLGVTQAAVSMAEKGKRPRMALRLLEAARRLAK